MGHNAHSLEILQVPGDADLGLVGGPAFGTLLAVTPRASDS